MKGTAIIIACLFVLACSPSLPPDFEEYVAEIEKLGMTEEARVRLTQVADVFSGATILHVTYSESAGVFGVQRVPSFCPAPGADPEEIDAKRQILRDKTTQVIALLRPIADSDGSGFISTAEANNYYSVMVTGMRTAFLIEEKGMSSAEAATALNMPAKEFLRTVAQYNAFLKAVPGMECSSYPEINIEATQA